MKTLVRWLLLAAALLLVAQLYSGVSVASFGTAMLAAFVVGLFNTLVRPLLVLLTLPVTLLTLGLFLFVINALMFWAAASLLDGFNVAGFTAALAVCPAAWTSKAALLERRGYSTAKLWMLKR